MTVSEGVDIHVTTHALWRAAERLGRSIGSDEIEREIRAAFAAGRVATERGPLGLTPGSYGLYAWALSGTVFALVANEERFFVTTVMTP